VPYHRIAFLQGDKLDLGVGVAEAPRKPTTWVFDMSGSVNTASVWPPEDSMGVPPIGDVNERPNPMAAHGRAAGPVGYIVTLSLAEPYSRFVHAYIETLDGKSVPIYINHSGNDAECERSVILIPRRPLEPFTTYKVNVKLISQDGDSMQKEW
jgi:hypothetical protein